MAQSLLMFIVMINDTEHNLQSLLSNEIEGAIKNAK